MHRKMIRLTPQERASVHIHPYLVAYAFTCEEGEVSIMAVYSKHDEWWTRKFTMHLPARIALELSKFLMEVLG